MSGSSAANSKRIQRFLQQADPRAALWRLFSEQTDALSAFIAIVQPSVPTHV